MTDLKLDVEYAFHGEEINEEAIAVLADLVGKYVAMTETGAEFLEHSGFEGTFVRLKDRV